MLVISAAQMGALSRQSETFFLHRAMEHCRQYWASACAELSDEQLSKRVAASVACAAEHGITSQNDKVVFVNLTFVWGEVFAADPRIPWAGEILNDSTLKGPAKVLQLRLRTQSELKRRQGEGHD